MIKESLMVYALRDGDLVHIDEVEKGVKCNCICPSCHAPLVARQGKLKIHHFAHRKAELCFTGCQTAVHMRAKDILAGLKQMRLPKYEFTYYDKIYHVSSMPVGIASVELEKRIDNIIPDIIVTTERGQKILVEIFVTHKVDEEKVQKIKALDIPTIEIGLSNCEISDDVIKAALTRDIDQYGRWVYFGKEQFYLDKIKTVMDTLPIAPDHSVRCPILEDVSIDKANPLKGYASECEYCKYRIGQSDGAVICTGRGYLDDVSELKYHLESRKKHFLSSMNVEGMMKALKTSLSYYASIPCDERIRKHGRRNHPLNRQAIQKIVSMEEVCDVNCTIPRLMVRGVTEDGELKEFFVNVLKDCTDMFISNAPAALIWKREWYKQHMEECDETVAYYQKVYNAYGTGKYRITEYGNISDADAHVNNRAMEGLEHKKFCTIGTEVFSECHQLFKMPDVDHCYVSAPICVNCPRYYEGFEDGKDFFCSTTEEREIKRRYETLERIPVDAIDGEWKETLEEELRASHQVREGETCMFLAVFQD